jgi:hypothetical protein
MFVKQIDMKQALGLAGDDDYCEDWRADLETEIKP